MSGDIYNIYMDLAVIRQVRNCDYKKHIQQAGNQIWKRLESMRLYNTWEFL